MREYVLKSWPTYFEGLWTKNKVAEIRKDDRGSGFMPGDLLILREYDPKTDKYSGREVHAKVLYVQYGIGLQDGYAALSLEILTRYVDGEWVDLKLQGRGL